MPRSFAPRLLSLIALGVIASPAVAGGCGGNSNVTPQKSGAGGNSGTGGSTAGRGGTSGSATGGTGNRGGTGGKGGQAGTMGIDDGGEAGASSGGSGGSGSAGKGGSGGSAGKGGSAGISSGGGAQGGSAGQSAGSGGQSGSAGNGTAGMVGVLGTQCSPPGALACAGNYQKLTVLCSGNGTWQPNQTCGTDSFCDSTPGPNVGTCQPVAAGCEDGPGTTFCDEEDAEKLLTCSADAVGTTIAMCDGMCRGAACREASECPVWSDYDDTASCATATECPGAFDDCSFISDECRDFAILRLGSGESGIVRTMWAEDTCQVCDGTGGAIVDVDVNLGASRAVRVTVPAPWKLKTTRTLNCSDAVGACVVLKQQYSALRFVSTTPEDGPVNIIFEDVPTSETCPPDGGEGGQPG